jgi:uncharacterized protein (DUF433 family)
VVAIDVLERDMYTLPEAARLLRVHPSTLTYWLEGGERRRKVYPPVIREQPTGSKKVTWGEFVEAGLLRQYRRDHEVRMVELRRFIDGVRASLGVKYPLAHHRPYVGEGKQLIRDIQDEQALPAELCLVAEASGQLVLTAPAEAFLARVEWGADDLPTAWRPHGDLASPVLMRPDVRFGLPEVGGVRTEVLWERLEEGADVAEVAADFSLSDAEVRWAQAYENSLRSAA